MTDRSGTTGRRRLAVAVSVAAVAIVAGCSSGAKGDGTPSPVATVTSTATVTSSAPAAATTAPATPGSSAPATTPAGSGNASGPGLCTPTVMTFAVTPNDGAGGSDYFQIRATNASKSPCVTTGFPGIAFLDAGGRQILQAVRQDPATVTTIVVAPGQEISARVQAEGSDLENGGTPCPSSPAFLLTLPDNTDSTRITHTTPVCSVGVAAFIRGSGLG